MTPDPLQQIREALTELRAWSLDAADKSNYVRAGNALKVLARLRLLPDGHAAVPVETVEQLIAWLAPTRPQDEDGEAAWMATHLRTCRGTARA